MMTFLFEVGVTNAFLTAILAIVVLAITRIWKNPHLGRFLWLIVLLKMVTPPLLNVPITFGLDWNESEVATSSRGDFDVTSLALSHDDTEVSRQEVGVSPGLEDMPSILAETQEASSKVMMSEGPKHMWSIYLGVVWLTGSLVCGLLAGLPSPSDCWTTRSGRQKRRSFGPFRTAGNYPAASCPHAISSVDRLAFRA